MNTELPAFQERGAIAVVVAIVSVAIFGVAALAVDVGAAYSDRRHMQNAADAAAIAGTNQLVQARWTTDGGSTPDWFFDAPKASGLETLVQDVLVSNDASASDYDCDVLDPNRISLASCAAAASWTESMWRSVEPVGVRVTAKSARPSVLGGIFGDDTIDAGAIGAAQVLPIAGGGGPFLVCGYSQYDNGTSSTQDPDRDILQGMPATPTGNVQPFDTDNQPYTTTPATVPTAWTYNPAAIGLEYYIHGPKVKKPCEFGNAGFDGLSEFEKQGVPLPGEFGTDTGVKAGPTRVEVANECGTLNTVGCVVLAPICVGPVVASPASKASLWCVKVGAFELTSKTDKNSHVGLLVKDVIVTGPVQTGGGTPKFFEPRTIQLVE